MFIYIYSTVFLYLLIDLFLFIIQSKMIFNKSCYPARFLTIDEFDNLSKIDKILSLLLIIYGKKDEHSIYV